MENARLMLILETFLEELAGNGERPTTVEVYRYMLRQFVDFLVRQGCCGLEDVTDSHVRQWMIQKRQQNLSEAYIHNCYRIPRRWWNWSIEAEFVENKPVPASSENLAAFTI